jgi:hypothetical protein
MVLQEVWDDGLKIHEKNPMMTDLKKLRDSNPVDLSMYRQLIGSLIYLENTQSDICFVGRLSYDIQIQGFIDSDWARSEDENKSSTWICFSLRFSTMSWASRKQSYVALSTAEAEYNPAYDACTKEVWLHKFVYVLFDQVLDSIVIYCDDQSCVKLLENLVFCDSSKHIEIKHYFLCDKFHRGEVVLQYISTDE